ncbi:hypothetical protein H6G54_23885 [Anabaena cylindrica FACHB-243]|nr:MULTISPECIES: hypothetical protein [Anabaena]MBD2420690.1 hypothetical protein [Anabaena cylindrica FACHB-243]MBY5284971.1 hypothetical protein [Anabaena sp. CCAP 1446/1C]MBY5311816.1 hypothetical protein [Anabaena sp. CCAP 1446/1C]MCM2408416.1 hypothetical protein [Anabaena sp. CCAP 1446/1C]
MTLLPIKTIANEKEPVNDLPSVNATNENSHTEKQLELEEVALEQKDLTPSFPEKTDVISFSAEQKLIKAKINSIHNSAYKLPEKRLHTTIGCRGHTLENYPFTPIIRADKPHTQEEFQPEISSCEENNTSFTLSDYSASEIIYGDYEQNINTKSIITPYYSKSLPEVTLKKEKLIAQSTNNQIQSQFNPVEPNLPVLPKEVPSLPIPEEKPEKNPEEKPEKPPQLTPEENRKVLRTLMRNLLNNSASRYPFFVNTSDKLIINPRNFQPLNFEFYSDFTFDLDKFKTGNPFQKDEFSDILIKSANISFYPEDEQFYWVLDGNRVVIETEGRHLNVGYQGNSNQQKIRQIAKVSTVFWGVQTVFAIPNIFEDLVGNKKLDDLNIISGAAEIVLPPGANLADNASFTINVTRPDGSFFEKFIPLDDTRKATTNALLGGGSFFGNLDATNTPRFLQGFPTVNLQPLLNNGVKLEIGSIIPRENLAAAGLILGDVFTKQGFSFNSPITSFPGIKTLQVNQSDNDDIVAVLSNPFLTKEQKDFHYLNSLMWYNLGQQSPEVATFSISDPQNKDWFRYTLSWSHNRTLLKYDPEKINLNYLNVFSNPGLSITTAQWEDTDLNQTMNASFGLMLGSVFNFINPGNLNQSISEAKEKYKNLQPLATLNTKATSQQRRQMNQRLNDTLNYGNTNSNFSQVSGSYTFASNITPDSSLLFQLRTGIYRRSVQFIEQKIEPWTPEAPVIIDFVRPSDLGPIFFTGINIPTNLTQINAPETFEVTFIRGETSDGEVLFDQSYVFDNNLSSMFTAVPIIGPGKSYDLDFGRIKLSTFPQRDIETSAYTGHLYLPAIELVASGSIDNFSYALSTGMWFNLFPDSAPVIDSNLGNLNSNATVETSIGGMLKFAAKADFQNIFYDDKKQWHTIIANSPFFSLTYNTNPNRLNLSNISLGNVFQFAKPDFNITFYPVLSYSPKFLNPDVKSNSLGDMSAFLLLNFSHKIGFDFNSSISLGNQALYQFETTYNIIKSKNFGTLKIGPYYTNNSMATKGFEGQLVDPNYGMIFRYESASSGLVIDSRLGNSEYGFRGQLNMELKF